MFKVQGSIIFVSGLYKSFPVGKQTVPVLKDISFKIKKGDFVIIYGPSGCGKSTLLHVILGLEPPTRGRVMVLGRDIYQATSEDERSDFRKKNIGMVYQQANWIKALTVRENTAFPLLLLGEDKADGLRRAGKALAAIGMEDWSAYVPTELSSGQQQKVALARALITDPEIIIADEPTGNLDHRSGEELMELLTNLNKKQGKTVVMVTHDLEYLKYAKTVVRMLDGRVAKMEHRR